MADLARAFEISEAPVAAAAAAPQRKHATGPYADLIDSIQQEQLNPRPPSPAAQRSNGGSSASTGGSGDNDAAAAVGWSERLASLSGTTSSAASAAAASNTPAPAAAANMAPGSTWGGGASTSEGSAAVRGSNSMSWAAGAGATRPPGSIGVSSMGSSSSSGGSPRSNGAAGQRRQPGGKQYKPVFKGDLELPGGPQWQGEFGYGQRGVGSYLIFLHVPAWRGGGVGNPHHTRWSGFATACPHTVNLGTEWQATAARTCMSATRNDPPCLHLPSLCSAAPACGGCWHQPRAAHSVCPADRGGRCGPSSHITRGQCAGGWPLLLLCGVHVGVRSEGLRAIMHAHALLCMCCFARAPLLAGKQMQSARPLPPIPHHSCPRPTHSLDAGVCV